MGVRAALVAGAAGSSSLPSEVASMQRDAIQILIGTPAKVNEIMNARGGLSGAECRLLIVSCFRQRHHLTPSSTKSTS